MPCAPRAPQILYGAAWEQWHCIRVCGAAAILIHHESTLNSCLMYLFISLNVHRLDSQPADSGPLSGAFNNFLICVLPSLHAAPLFFVSCLCFSPSFEIWLSQSLTVLYGMFNVWAIYVTFFCHASRIIFALGSFSFFSILRKRFFDTFGKNFFFTHIGPSPTQLCRQSCGYQLSLPYGPSFTITGMPRWPTGAKEFDVPVTRSNRNKESNTFC